MRIFASGKARSIWIAIGMVLLAGIWVASLMPHPPRISGGDKLHHFLAYAASGFWWCVLATTWRVRATWITGLALMGVLIELLQQAGGFRHFEIADMIANATGALTGGVLASIVPFRPLPPARSS